MHFMGKMGMGQSLTRLDWWASHSLHPLTYEFRCESMKCAVLAERMTWSRVGNKLVAALVDGFQGPDLLTRLEGFVNVVFFARKEEIFIHQENVNTLA